MPRRLAAPATPSSPLLVPLAAIEPLNRATHDFHKTLETFLPLRVLLSRRSKMGKEFPETVRALSPEPERGVYAASM